MQDRRDLCPDVDDFTIELIPDIDSDWFPSLILNTDLVEMLLHVACCSSTGRTWSRLSQNIGINGNATLVIRPLRDRWRSRSARRENSTLTLRALNFEGLSRSDLVLFTLINGDG